MFVEARLSTVLGFQTARDSATARSKLGLPFARFGATLVVFEGLHELVAWGARRVSRHAVLMALTAPRPCCIPVRLPGLSGSGCRLAVAIRGDRAFERIVDSA